jgi:hypothetical protein
MLTHQSQNIMPPIEVTVGRQPHLQIISISNHAQEACPVLASIPEGSHLPGMSCRALRAVLRYLDRNDLSILRTYSAFQRLFVKAWVLAGRLGLPVLQNELVSHQRKEYLHAKKNRTTFKIEHEAFEYLKDHSECGKTLE